MGDLDLPFEPTSGHLIDEHVHLSGGLVVLASMVRLDDGTPSPALGFLFAKTDGSGFYPLFLLVATPKQLRDLVRLVEASTEAACEAAS